MNDDFDSLSDYHDSDSDVCDSNGESDAGQEEEKNERGTYAQNIQSPGTLAGGVGGGAGAGAGAGGAGGGGGAGGAGGELSEELALEQWGRKSTAGPQAISLHKI